MITGNNPAEIIALKVFLNDKFKIKDLRAELFFGHQDYKDSSWIGFNSKEVCYVFIKRVSV